MTDTTPGPWTFPAWQHPPRALAAVLGVTPAAARTLADQAARTRKPVEFATAVTIATATATIPAGITRWTLARCLEPGPWSTVRAAYVLTRLCDPEPPPPRCALDGSPLAYVADLGAPGRGQAWECAHAAHRWVKIGGEFYDPDDSYCELRPADVR